MPVLFSSYSIARSGPAAAVRPQVGRGALWTSCLAACRSCVQHCICLSVTECRHLVACCRLRRGLGVGLRHCDVGRCSGEAGGSQCGRQHSSKQQATTMKVLNG